jgi:hypothetical protein
MNNFQRLIDEDIKSESYKKDKTGTFIAKEEDGGWSVIGEFTKFRYEKKLKKEKALEITDRMNKWK